MNELTSNTNNKSTWALFVSILAMVLSLLVLMLWIFEVIPHSVISSETFIGACVTLLGVIVTVAVGAQIVNVMEVKSAQRKYEAELKTAFEKIQHQQEQIEEEQHRNSLLHNCNQAKFMQDGNQYGKACYYYICALYENLQLKTPLGNETYILEQFSKCLEQKDGGWSISNEMHNELKNADTLIRQHVNYHWVKTQYEHLRNEYFNRIGK